MQLEEAFSRLHGRAPSDRERTWLVHVRDALDLRENDAFLYILMMLEHYDALYRMYPHQIAEETERALGVAREAFAAAARVEAAEAQRLLAEEVAKTSVEIAKKLAEEPIRVHRVTAALACLVLFGSICLAAGCKLASTGRPFWVNEGHASHVLAVVLGAPAGWMVFALLLPAGVYGARTGWLTARSTSADPKESALGWALLTISVIGISACLMILVRMV